MLIHRHDRWSEAWLDSVRRHSEDASMLRRRIKHRKALGASTSHLSERLQTCQEMIYKGFAAVELIEGEVGYEAASVVECYYIECLSWRQVAEQTSMSTTACLRLRDKVVKALDRLGWESVGDAIGLQI